MTTTKPPSRIGTYRRKILRVEPSGWTVTLECGHLAPYRPALYKDRMANCRRCRIEAERK